MRQFLATRAALAARSKVLLRALAVGLFLLWPVSTVRAAITATGNVSPANPATWTSDTIGYVGFTTSSGSVNVGGGSNLVSKYCCIGALWPGVATVDGTGSTWTNGSDLTVGYADSGTLNISGGGAVTVGGATYVAFNPGFTGAINFGSGGGTLTTQSLYASPTQLTGTGTINANGLVSDVDLVFDSAISLSQTLNFNQPGQNITVNLTTGGDLGAGATGSGSLTIKNGITINSHSGCLGYAFGSNGVAAVDGAGSTWANSSDLTVGDFGNGTLIISGGAAVTVNGATYVARQSSWSIGAIKFGSGGGTLTTTSLVASPNQLTGTGTINAHGLVSDLDLVFDSTASLSQTLNFSQSGQNIALNLDMGANPSKNGYLGAGATGSGSLTICKGVTVKSDSGYLGYSPGSVGVATVEGTGSMWTTSGLTVGNFGSGTLNITGGGTVNGVGYVGYLSGSNGVVTVDGTNSTWNNSGGELYVGFEGCGSLNITRGGTVNSVGVEIGDQSTGVVTVDGSASTWNNNSGMFEVGLYGSGTLNITGGGTVNSGNQAAYVGVGMPGAGVVTVDGAGSTWNNVGRLYVYKGALNVSGGGAVTAAYVWVRSGCVLGIDVGNGSSVTLSGNGTFANSGTVRVLAGAGATTGKQYSPISATTWSDSGGTYQALGGKWDSSSHVFTVSDFKTGTAGTPLSIDLASEQRVLIGDGGTDPVGASFLASTSSKLLTLTATTIGSDAVTALDKLLDPHQALLSGWQFAFSSGYAAGDPAYLSFDVGAGYSRNGLEVWHYDGTDWTEFDASDLTYDGTYASFTVTGFSGYAVTTVPEPGTLALLVAAGVGLLAYARQKRMTGKDEG